MPIKYKPQSFHLQWHITERCNLKCKHCYFDRKFLDNELSLKELFRILDNYLRLIKKWGISVEKTRISITGGEPLVRNDFFEFLEKCHENKEKSRYGVLTNGILLNNEKISKLKKLEVNYVQVSLEGMEENNDEIRGKGTFKKIVKAIKLLVKNKINTSISTTVTKQNQKDIPLLIKLAEQLKVNGLGLRRFIPIGRGEGIKKLILSPQETKKLYLYVVKTNQKLADKKSKLRLNIGCEDGILAQEGYEVNTCVAGYSSLTILPNGDVYPCRRLPIYVGNCIYFNECRGGAKCVSYGYWKDSYIEDPQFLPDPQCWRLFK